MLAFSALTGWLLFGGLIGVTGAVAGRWIILPRVRGVARAQGPVLRDATSRLGLGAAVLLSLAMCLFFVRQVSEFRDPFAPWVEDARILLTATSWGRVWVLGLTGSFVTAVGFGLAAAGWKPGWWVATLGVLGLSTFPAFTGHASGGDGPTGLMVAADTLHVFAAGSWIGGLLLVLYLEVRSRSSAGEGGSLLPDLVPAFSPLAVASVVVMIVTGTLASWVHVGSFTTLFTTRYGRLLSLKLLLVAIVMVLGANNWKRLTPKLGDPGGPRAMRRAAVTEVILAQAVLLLTAILVRMSPM